MIYNFNSQKKTLPALIIVLVVLGAAVFGALSGYGGSMFMGKSSGTTTTTTTEGVEKVSTAKAAGLKDKKTFPDEVAGLLKEGGADGEGSFHLVRPGGESQNVYLTSTTVDLSVFLNKKVTVWGQTFEGEKAGWLMDVGYIEIKD